MRDIVSSGLVLPPSSPEAIDFVQRLEDKALAGPQVPIWTDHLIHNGSYYRTIMLPAGVQLTGALIKIPTTLTISGDCEVMIGEETVRISGYAVLPASAGRKQAFVAISDTHLTMSFPTLARNPADAEMEFTDDYLRLFSRHNGLNSVRVTGED